VSEQSGKSQPFVYYDRDVDIVRIPVSSSNDFFGDEQAWGLLIRDRVSGSVAAIEIWSASEVLPGWLLDALPGPAPSNAASD
jgi:uncharacterized protein YuzE